MKVRNVFFTLCFLLTLFVLALAVSGCDLKEAAAKVEETSSEAATIATDMSAVIKAVPIEHPVKDGILAALAILATIATGAATVAGKIAQDNKRATSEIVSGIEVAKGSLDAASRSAMKRDLHNSQSPLTQAIVFKRRQELRKALAIKKGK